MSEEPNLKKKKPFYKKWWVWLIIFIIFAAALNTEDEAEQGSDTENHPIEVSSEEQKDEAPETEVVEEETEEEVVEEVAEEPADLESQVRAIVHESVGDKNNMDKERIVELNIVDLPEGSNVVLDLNASDNLTTNMMRTGILANSMDIIEPLSKVEDVANIKLVWLFPLIDQYGNEEDSRVLSFVIDKETRDKINWENFDQNNLSEVTADYFEHPALTN